MFKYKNLMKIYQNRDFIVQLKAKFIFYCCLAILIILPVIICYSAYIQFRTEEFGYTLHKPILIAELTGILLTACGLYLLSKGRFFISAHLIIITAFLTTWLVIFLDRASTISRFDTISFIFCILSMVPLVVSQKKRAIVMYPLINIIILGIFTYIAKQKLQISENDALDFFADNTMAILFICITSYNIFVINNKALAKAEEDIQERKIAEEALKKSEERYRLIAENVTDVIWTLGLDLNFTYLSPSIVQLSGYSVEELMKKPLHDILSPDSLNHVRKVFTQSLKLARENSVNDHQSMTLELEQYKKDRTCIWTESQVTFLHDNMGYINGILGVTRDISERKKAEEEKIKLKAQLIQAQRLEAIGTLAGGIAHDFNNILTGIFGHNQLLKLKLPEHTGAVEHIDQIHMASLRARDLVQQILDFSRQSKQIMKPVRVESIIKEVVMLLRATLPAAIDIQQNIQDNLSKIYANETQIHQLLVNLCTNAFHAMEENGGKLTISLEPIEFTKKHPEKPSEIEPGSYLKLSVEDSGYGMDTDTLHHIFDPYFTTKDHGQGSGLGLSVVHGIVKSHEGAITVSSNIGRGTRFDIFFPCIENNEPDEPELQSELPKGNETILFVDDEEMIADLGRDMLKLLGYTPICFSDPEKAVRAFRKSPDRFDAVITDMAMPGMSGEKLAKNILATRKDIPVILCTGYSKVLSEERAKKIGIRAYLMKPLSINRLSKTLRNILDKK